MSFSTQDTIVAIATPPGRGGIGVVRLSGPVALTVAQTLIRHRQPLQPRHATLSKVRPSHFAPRPGVARDDAPDCSSPDTLPSGGGDAIDQVVATFFPGPRSYTGEDVVELSAHGSPVVLGAIVSAAIDAGARLAEPGEFTLRAYLNGRIDLMQAEAVSDLIEAVTPLQARAAFDQLDGTLTRTIGAIDATLFDLIARLEASVDFPEEGYHFVEPGALAQAIDGLLERTAALLDNARRGRLIREGLTIAIVGEPNVGKSSLFNALAGSSRAIVTDVPGTTRDLVTEVVEIEGLQVTLVDTAGLRDTADPVEIEGVSRAHQAMAVADLVLLVEDRSRPRPERRHDDKVLYVANKNDLAAAWHDDRAVAVSATSGDGLEVLRRRIAVAFDVDLMRDRPAMTNVRHLALVGRAHEALARARAAALAQGVSMPEEFVLADLTDARAALEEISGRRAPEDLLEHIFSRFCIGK
ncbi:MAG TPA: tRNA uridine-5-carboxymethylaminomethyl(34) synthesis GTPase MnmE [Vicinamibacterales bacterium]|nr:tRNA uridine-5-carboxymethylaminomethyl(34) synthesis GTPase MnmE [Vicinamibacterales bacterium]